jgi:hypothetical protein
MPTTFGEFFSSFSTSRTSGTRFGHNWAQKAHAGWYYSRLHENSQGFLCVFAINFLQKKEPPALPAAPFFYG